MKKILFVISGLALLPCTASAVIADKDGLVSATASSYSGVYAGLGIGGIFGHFSTSSSTEAPPPPFPYLGTLDGTTSMSDATLLGTALIGYNLFFRQVLLSAEFYGRTGHPHQSFIISSSDIDPTERISTAAQVQLNSGEFGIDGRLGILAAPSTLIYARVGAAFNKLTLNSNTTVFSSATTPDATLFLNDTFTNSVVGTRLGAGLEQKISEKVSIRTDYVYTQYGKVSGSISATHPDPEMGTINNQATTRVQTHSVMATLVYNFNA